MNERIKELAEDAGVIFVSASTDYLGEYFPSAILTDKMDLEKFAELIVKECAQYMYEHYPHSRYEVNYMRKHMGDPNWNKPIGVDSISKPEPPPGRVFQGYN